MPVLGLYSWSQYTLPAGIPSGHLTGDTTPNDPASPTHASGSPSWIGETFTFNGGQPTQIDITDDDGVFEDGYVETGAVQTLGSAVTIDGTLYPAGSVVENEFSLIDGSGQEIYVVRISGENVGLTYGNGEDPTPGDTFTATSGLDGSPSDNVGAVGGSAEPYADVICYLEGTLIDTPFGARRVETFAPGDKVCVAGMAAQPVMWLGMTNLDLTRAPAKCRPVLVEAGALGRGLPRRDLMVSQQHRILILDAGQEVFVPVKALLGVRGVRVMSGRKRVRYVHLLLPQHGVIRAEGLQSESFYPGPTALAMMRPAARAQVLEVLGRIIRGRGGDYGPLARRASTVREGEAMAARLRARLDLVQAEPQDDPRQIQPPPRIRLPSVS